MENKLSNKKRSRCVFDINPTLLNSYKAACALRGRFYSDVLVEFITKVVAKEEAVLEAMKLHYVHAKDGER